MSIYRLEFVTPLFSRGAYEDRIEVRPASIRGQLHWWFRALGGNPQDEKSVFGGVHGGAVASKVVVRVRHPALQGEWIPSLPHKPQGRSPQDGPNAPRIAARPGLAVELHILTRLGGLEPRLKPSFDRALEGWLLLGTLGLRSTRAAGSFRWTSESAAPHPPASFGDYEARCRAVLANAPLRFALLGKEYPAAEAARRVVSDTLGGRDDVAGSTDLAKLRHPLGKVFGGRKTSPLRFRIVRMNDRYRIAAVWDGRGRVTGNQPADLIGIIRLLQERKPALGDQLAESRLMTTIP
ncbi:MAG: type III-B CRISPR module RAMP protein Cmr1 [Verrucomicrobiales bacterium]|nr:type III-B CRISPR module RAMP protein Cmr1 [Verrucomicrobiales bacterium]